MYHEINETAARRAREANSFREYKPGSATAEYRTQVDKAVQIAEVQKQCVDSLHHERIDHYLALYSKKLAEWYNRHFEIEARVPSIMIAGGSNFPTRAKEKQNAAREKHMEEYQHIQGLLDKIRGAGPAGISSDDENAIAKLKDKLTRLEESQQFMKDVNAYFRKHKTLDGCPTFTGDDAVLDEIACCMRRSWRDNPKPFEAWALSNNSANMRRIRERIAQLERKAEKAAAAAELPEGAFDGWEFEGGRVLRNHAENRLQILFDGKPEESIRTELKKRGFRWSPKQGAWQRQLNNNAEYDAKSALKSVGLEVSTAACPTP